MNKSYTADVVIIGAGIAGLTLACLLEKHTTHRVIIVERGDAMRHRVSAVNSSSVQLWKHLGIWDESTLQASPYWHMHVWDHCGAKIDFDAAYVTEEPLGFIVQDQRLHDALLARLKNSTRVRLLNDQVCREILQHEDQVCLQTEEATIYAQYLIACDGAHSWVREQMSFAMTSWPYHHTAIIAQVVTEKSHHQTAWQKFTDEGPLAFLPLLDIHQSSIVWSVAPQRAEELLALSDEDFSHELGFTSEGILGKVTQVSERFAFPLTLRHVKDYVKDRVILCADAAHTIHPMAGQGLNLAMQDVMALFDVFVVMQSGGGVSRALRSYQRARKAETWQMMLILEAIKRMYEIKIPAAMMMINASVECLDKANPLKSLMFKLASGDSTCRKWMA